MNENKEGTPSVCLTTNVNGRQRLVCSCGATAFLSEEKRFRKRHPALCSARKAFAKQLAAGTRCVDSEERYGERWGRS